MPSTKRLQERTAVQVRFGLAWINKKPADISPLEFSSRRHLRVAHVKLQADAARRALHRAIGIADGDVIDRSGVGAEQPMIEAELPDQRHFPFQVGGGAKSRSFLGRV